MLKRLRGQAGRQVHRRYRHHAHPAGRRQVHLHHRPDPGPGQARQERDRRHPPAFGRPDHEHQGFGGRRRPVAGHPAHAVLARPHRRHQRHHERPQPGHGGAHLAHAARVQLQRRAAGQAQAEAAEHRPAQRRDEVDHRLLRPVAPRDHHRHGRQVERLHDEVRLRHRRLLRSDGHPGRCQGPEGHARAHGQDRRRLQQGRHSRSPPRTSVLPAP